MYSIHIHNLTVSSARLSTELIIEGPVILWLRRWQTAISLPLGGYILASERVRSTLDSASPFAIIFSLAYHQRLSRVAEGTGPLKPQQPGPCAKVLIPAQWGEIRSSVDRNPGR